MAEFREFGDMSQVRVVCNNDVTAYMDSINHSSCSHCGQWKPTDSLTQGFCVRCRARGLIRSYDANVLDFFNPLGGTVNGTKKRKPRYYGIELEVEPTADRIESASKVLDAVGHFSILKRDGSLSEQGFEIVTTPMTFDHHRSGIWDKFFIDGGNENIAVNNSCGMHVHISRNTLTRLQIGKMVSFIHSPDNRGFIKVVAQRNANRYMDFTADKGVTEPLSVEGSHDERYTALNLVPRNTVELRIFKGTTKAETFFKNLEFTDALVNFCGNGYSIAESSNYQLFTIYCYFERKRYPNLWKFLVDKQQVPNFANAKEARAAETEIRDAVLKSKSEKEKKAMEIPASKRGRRFFGSSRNYRGSRTSRPRSRNAYPFSSQERWRELRISYDTSEESPFFTPPHSARFVHSEQNGRVEVLLDDNMREQAAPVAQPTPTFSDNWFSRFGEFNESENPGLSDAIRHITQLNTQANEAVDVVADIYGQSPVLDIQDSMAIGDEQPLPSADDVELLEPVSPVEGCSCPICTVAAGRQENNLTRLAQADIDLLNYETLEQEANLFRQQRALNEMMEQTSRQYVRAIGDDIRDIGF
jgi:hypothetical protein